jgi:hypothetical protein
MRGKRRRGNNRKPLVRDSFVCNLKDLFFIVCEVVLGGVPEKDI